MEWNQRENIKKIYIDGIYENSCQLFANVSHAHRIFSDIFFPYFSRSFTSVWRFLSFRTVYTVCLTHIERFSIAILFKSAKNHSHAYTWTHTHTQSHIHTHFAQTHIFKFTHIYELKHMRNVSPQLNKGTSKFYKKTSTTHRQNLVVRMNKKM